jgi:hypothetical protein
MSYFQSEGRRFETKTKKMGENLKRMRMNDEMKNSIAVNSTDLLFFVAGC